MARGFDPKWTPVVGLVASQALEGRKWKMAEAVATISKAYGMSTDAAAGLIAQAGLSKHFSFTVSAGGEIIFKQFSFEARSGRSAKRHGEVYETLRDGGPCTMMGLVGRTGLRPFDIQDALKILEHVGILASRTVDPGVEVYELVAGREPVFFPPIKGK